MIPVSIEHIGDILYYRPHADHVQVAELGILPEAEIFVGYIAPADDRDLVVDGERLVVHAPVDSAESRQRALRPARGAAVKRVEYSNLEVRVRMQRRQTDVVATRKHVVHQQPHANAAIGCLQKPVDKYATDDVVLDQVVLQVDALLGTFCE